MQTTLPDLTPVLTRYETLTREADALFLKIREAHPASVTCREGCSDCCHALFDLPLVEAVSLRRAFEAAFPPGPERSAVLERAGRIDRQVHQIKRNAFKALQNGMDNDAILAAIGRERSRCPLLDAEERCLLYASRPLTCRLYGVPAAIGDKTCTCGLSAFEKGRAYPTVRLEKIQNLTAELSFALARLAGSRYAEIHTLLVPVSMALLDSYDAAYFGLGTSAECALLSGKGGRHA